MKIIFSSIEERDAFHRLLEFAAYGENIEDDLHQSILDTCDGKVPSSMLDFPDGNEQAHTLVKIKEEHIKRMSSFLRSFANVMRFTTTEEGEDGEYGITGHADHMDYSLVWNGTLTIGMICTLNKERPWAAEWSCHS